MQGLLICQGTAYTFWEKAFIQSPGLKQVYHHLWYISQFLKSNELYLKWSSG